MNSAHKHKALTLFAAAALCAPASSGAHAAAAAHVATVISSNSGPYQEALAGLREELGESVPIVHLADGERVPSSAKIIVAFGSRAALESYPAGATVIYAMAPGIETRHANSTEIHMEPDARALLASMRSVQPGLRRLGILWRSERLKGYMQLIEQEAAALGISVSAVHLHDNALLPNKLRALHGSVDALWLPPDPLLLNSTTLPVLVEFSRGGGIPLYVPTGGLIEHGATAAFGPSFREFGRLAGRAAKQILNGERAPGDIYAAQLEGFISRSSATRAGIDLAGRKAEAGEKLLP